MEALTRQIALFCSHLDTERNVSPHTLAAYRQDLEQLAAFIIREKDDSATVADVDHLLLRRYLALLGKSVKKSSIGRKLAAIRSFFRYLLRCGVVTKNPAELIATPKKENRLPFHLDIDQVTTLVEAPANDQKHALRDRAILEMLYSCGLRVAEVTGLDFDELELSCGTVRGSGSGGGRASFKLWVWRPGERCVRAKAAWFVERSPSPRPSPRGEGALSAITPRS